MIADTRMRLSGYYDNEVVVSSLERPLIDKAVAPGIAKSTL
jgi:hypothetical protein